MFFRPQRRTHEHCTDRKSVQQKQRQSQAEGERMDQRIWHNGPKGNEYQSVKSIDSRSLHSTM